MPSIGFGLWKNTLEASCKQSIRWALDAGYRHFDTAQAYGNEHWLGDVLSEKLAAGELKRDDLFITTKIAVQHFGAKRTASSFDVSYASLKLDSIDLVLLHFPVPVLRTRAWKALETIQESGRVKHIGVSNFTIKHLVALFESCRVKPVVNQVELHVFLQQPELLEFCRQHDILVEAYSPLAHGRGLDNEVLAQIGQKHNKTPTQVMLRWCVEQGTIPLPKSVHQERIAQNFAIFDFVLDTADRQRLQSLNQNLRTCWDPTHIP